MTEIHESTKYESKDISLKVVILIAVGTFTFLTAIAVFTYFIIGYKSETYRLSDSVSHPSFPEFDVNKKFPDPKLQFSPRLDWQQYKISQTKLLESYGWVNQAQGRARVPIELAMKIFVSTLTSVTSPETSLKDAMYAQQKKPQSETKDKIGFDQKLGNKIDLNLTFTSESNKLVRIKDIISNEKPAILVLAYYGCANLCTIVLNKLFTSLNSLSYKAARDYELIIVSINENENSKLALSKKNVYLQQFRDVGKPEGLHFLTGDKGSIAKLADQIGFRFAYDKNSKEYAHPAGATLLATNGVISRYIFGIDFPPRDLRLALVDASKRLVGHVTDQFLLFCYRYDPVKGTYSFAIFRFLQISGLFMVTALALLIGRYLREEHQLTKRRIKKL